VRHLENWNVCYCGCFILEMSNVFLIIFSCLSWKKHENIFFHPCALCWITPLQMNSPKISTLGHLNGHFLQEHLALKALSYMYNRTICIQATCACVFRNANMSFFYGHVFKLWNHLSNKKTKCLRKHPSNHLFAPCKLHHMYGIIWIEVECQDLSQAIQINYMRDWIKVFWVIQHSYLSHRIMHT
jgi:hypothetical protein